jgi:hypothetical protein
VRLSLGIIVVDMMASTDGDGGSTSAVTSSCYRSVGNRGSVAFGHGETKRRKKQIERRENELNGWMRVGRFGIQRE